MAKRLLILGAGKSATTLIQFWLNKAAIYDVTVVVADMDAETLNQKLGNHPKGEAWVLDFNESESYLLAIESADLVISMLPPTMHPRIARMCLLKKKHLITASYVSPEMQAFDSDAKSEGLLFLNEMGVDPGIDHMTAMEMLDQLRAKGATITGFESFTGGLMAPSSEMGPWKYKFTWNPRNVVLAASGGAVKFLHGGKYKFIPYHKVFRRTELIEIGKYGEFEAYGNRDSLKYKEQYNLLDAHTIYRGTLRRPGFCRAWDVFIQLGATDDSYKMDLDLNFTHRDFINSFLYYHPTDSVEVKLALALHLELEGDEMRKLRWLDMFENIPIGIDKPASPAEILQKILEKKWSLIPGEKDMIMMLHRVSFILNSQEFIHSSYLAVEGDDERNTAMAKTVGLPMAIAAELIFKNELKLCGVHIPVKPEIYTPVLKELDSLGIQLKHFSSDIP
jgi:saccharopine dehydrogenase-like NADP-dependent oxidoreductase